MFASITKKLFLNVVGDSVALDIRDLSSVRAQAEMRTGTVGAAVLEVDFAVRPGGTASELSSGDRLTLATTLFHATAISCSGYSTCVVKVRTASGSADDTALVTIAGYSDHPLQVKDYGIIDESNRNLDIQGFSTPSGEGPGGGGVGG